MVTLVIGPLRSGKTTRLLEIATSCENAGGFACPKRITDGEHLGYTIQSIASGASTVFSRRQGITENGWEAAEAIGDWCISKDGLRFADKTIAEDLESGRSPVFVDEIGPLELMDRGFAKLFRNLLSKPVPVVAVVREKLVDQVVDHFHIQQYTRIDVKARDKHD